VAPTASGLVETIRRILLWCTQGSALKRVFVDTGFWIALLNEDDDLHSQAQILAESLQSSHWITTEMVLTELLNFLGSKGKNIRRAAVTFVDRLGKSPDVTILRQTSAQFSSALSLYSQRPDKAWSLTDCASFLVMKKAGLTEALAYDLHFEQAGFVALLRKR
jgi:predicted nucleic acid-binding protein